MLSLTQLVIPIVVSAVLVFVASSLIHMVFKWHNRDYRGLPNEDAVRTVLRAGNVTPGTYVVPYCADMKDMKKPEMVDKFKQGPNAFITVMKSGEPSMGKPLGLWFALNLAISIVAGYLAAHTVIPDASFLAICRVVGIVGFLAYAGGSVSSGIWMGKPPGSVAREVLDAFIYGLVMALAFGWLWPR
jgi:hypothetical protein